MLTLRRYGIASRWRGKENRRALDEKKEQVGKNWLAD
jgi:hypothetical protein